MSRATAVAHPDYALMARVLDDQENSLPDGWEDQAPANETEAVQQMKNAFGHLADPEALYQTSMEAMGGALNSVLPELALGLTSPHKAFAAIWASAFLAGVRFQQAGGHTEVQ